MRSKELALVAGLCVLAAGVTIEGSALAQYWGTPWGPGWGGAGGPGTATQERRVMMNEHRQTMQELKHIFDGRQRIDRRRATELARKVESGAGENLWRLYAPGTNAPGSRATPWIWQNFDTFKGYSEALKTTAAALADALEAEPTQEDFRNGVWVPQGNRGPGGPWGVRSYGPWGSYNGVLTKDAAEAFGNLVDTCNKCHDNFRYARW